MLLRIRTVALVLLLSLIGLLATVCLGLLVHLFAAAASTAAVATAIFSEYEFQFLAAKPTQSVSE